MATEQSDGACTPSFSSAELGGLPESLLAELSNKTRAELGLPPKQRKPAPKKRKGEFAILKRGERREEVRVMARAEGYAMVRFSGCMPFAVCERDLLPPNAGNERTAD